MSKNKFMSEYVLKQDGSEVCPECGHIWTEEGAGHYHDCRYFTFEDALEEEEFVADVVFRQPQMSLFRPAA